MDYINNPHRYNGRIAIALLLAAALLVMSCNPVKRVMRDPAKFDKVGKAWLKAQPAPTGIPEDSISIGPVDTTWHKWEQLPNGGFWIDPNPANDSGFFYTPLFTKDRGLLIEQDTLTGVSRFTDTTPRVIRANPCPDLLPVLNKPKTVFTTPQSVKDQIKILSGKLNLVKQDHSRDTALLRADIVRLNGELSNMTESRDKWRNKAISTWVILALIIAGILFARKYKA